MKAEKYKDEVNAILESLGAKKYHCDTEAEAIRLLWFVVRDEKAIMEDHNLALQCFRTLFNDFRMKVEAKHYEGN